MWHLHFYALHFHTPRISSGIQRGLQQQVTETTSSKYDSSYFPSFLPYLGNQPQQYCMFYDQPEKKVQIPDFSQWIALENKYEDIL